MGKISPVSLKKDLFGVHGPNPKERRSLKKQMQTVGSKPVIRIAIVTVRPENSKEGPYRFAQRDLDVANEIWQRDVGVWIHCVAHEVVYTNLLGENGVLDQPYCPLGIQYNPTDEEDQLFDLGRKHETDLVGYYIAGSTNPGLVGCSAYPKDRRGFWVRFNAHPFVFAHEITHVVGLNPHPQYDPQVDNNDRDNIMWPTPRFITNPPPDIRAAQRDRIQNDPAIEHC